MLENSATEGAANENDDTVGGARSRNTKSTMTPFHRPQWSKPGTITKELLIQECELLSGVKLSQSQSPSGTLDIPGSRGARSRQANREGATAEGPAQKRRRVQHASRENRLMAKTVVSKMWTEATGWVQSIQAPQSHAWYEVFWVYCFTKGARKVAVQVSHPIFYQVSYNWRLGCHE